VKALVGLGNPGRRYAETRHNLGFRIADTFTARHASPGFRRDGSSLASEVFVAGEPVLVVKPQTFMNRSGEAVREVVERHGVRDRHLLVAHDDLDLELGTVRIKVGGGHGGHNGLRSILDQAGAGEFVRVRLGIRRPDPAIDAVDWVLEPFSSEERTEVDRVVERGTDAVDAVLRLGPERAMTEYNRRSPQQEERPQ
jgi:PTH1 family peptidyl-tRNA hydrolase